MPTPLVENGLYQFTVVCRAESQTGLMINYWHAQNPTGDPPTEEDFIAVLDLEFSATVRALLSEWAELRGYTLKRLFPTEGDAIAFTGGAGPGNVVGDMMSSQTAGVISLRSGFAGRSNRGRKYVPFLSETHNDTLGKPTAACKTLLADLGEDYTTSITVAGGGGSMDMLPVLKPNPLGSVPTNLNSFIVRPEWGTQRRRSKINAGDALPIP